MTKKIILSVIQKTPPEMIHYVQHSTEIPLEFYFADYPIPDQAIANLYIKKPSGLEVYNAGTIEENSVIIQPSAQLFAEAGVQEGQLQIAAHGKILVTFLLCFNIEKNIIKNSAIESTNEYTALDKLLTEAKQAIPDAQNAAKAANSAAGAATSAAGSANTEAGRAEKAADAAETASGKANGAAGSANTAASAANTAAARANSAAEAAEDIVLKFFERIYPVGSIYISTVSTNPNSLFGGTWQRIQRRFLLAADDSTPAYNAGKTGGSETVDHYHMLPIGFDLFSGRTSFYITNGNSATNTIQQNITRVAHDFAESNATGNARVSSSASTSINIMPPFLAVYVWKRTA